MQVTHHSVVYKTWFWICATIISVALAFHAYRFFPRTYPIVSLDLTMDRSQALEKARDLAQRYHWGPEGDYRQTALFDSDGTAKNFIDLEGGGQNVVRSVIQENELALYSWNVRHFKEGDAHETIIMFKPDGTPYGFQETIPQNVAGTSLSQEQARVMAEQQASSDWNIAFEPYQLIEQGQETTPSGRVDHTFVYERTDKKIGQAPYRLLLAVSGNKLTKVKPFLHVPEGFKRRYQHMRSFNETLAMGAYFLQLFLYLIGGCIIGLFFLLRRRDVLIKPALIWAGALSIGFFINAFNDLPLAWYDYPTALSTFTFLSRYIFSAFSSGIYMFGQLFVTFAAAEGLTRLAFKDHIQLWKSWNTNVASSWEMLGRKLGGYLLVGVSFAFVISFYFITRTYFGWWSPTDTLIDPNILATYVPWYASLLKSLMAGFREECFFRAIPLSLGMLLTKRFNNRGWIIGAFILQAVIFGAAHANYAAQPFYARLVELSLLSCMFGIIYLLYGLVTVTVCHYLYDVVWFALPLFISEAPGIWLSRSFVVIGSAVPLLIIGYAYFKKGHFSYLQDRWYNGAWRRPAGEASQEHIKPVTSTPSTNLGFYVTCIVGTLGGLWWVSTLLERTSSFIPLAITRNEVLAQSKIYAQHNTALAHYTPLTTVESPLNKTPRPTATDIATRKEKESAGQDQHYFIWKTLGKDAYRDLQNSYLSGPYWRVRYVTFEGDVAERAHEQQYHVQAGDKLIRSKEKLPENATRQSVTEQEARQIALNVLAQNYHKEKDALQEIVALPSRKPNRTDWKFVFTDLEQPLKEGGQARITVKIAGSDVVDHYRWVFVPEEYERSAAQQRNMLLLISSLCALLLFLATSLGAASALIEWAYRHTHFSALIFIGAVLAIKTALQVYNLIPSYMADFHTSEPLNNQLFTLALSVIWFGLTKIVPIALIAAGIAASTTALQKATSSLQILIYGIATGLYVYGAALCIIFFGPHTKPLWPVFTHAGAQIPWLSFALTTLTQFISTMLILQFLWIFVYTFTHGTYRTVITGIVCILIGLCIMENMSLMSVTSWLWQGTLLGILIALRIPHDIRVVSIATGTFIGAQALTTGLQEPYPGALLGACVSLILIAAVCSVWNWYYIDKDSHDVLRR